MLESMTLEWAVLIKRNETKHEGDRAKVKIAEFRSCVRFEVSQGLHEGKEGEAILEEKLIQSI